MKQFFTLTVALTLISLFSNATIRRVGYNGLPVVNVDFPSMQEAHDFANAGDTIQVYGLTYNFGGLTATKQLVYIGFGYNFDVHPGVQAIGTDLPSAANISFYGGSDGSIVTGISGTFAIGDQTQTGLTVSNLKFERCYGVFNFANYQLNGSISNIKIISCVIQSGGMQYNSGLDLPVTNLQVYNSIISNFNLYKAGTTASFINCVSPSLSIINGPLYLNDASVLVKNCILAYASYPSTNINTVYENNFFGEAQPATLPPGSNNRWNQDWSVLFNRISPSDDNASYYGYTEFDENYYVLKAGSPAINGGFNAANAATNCGIFGGELLYAYRVSGVPSVPSIYKLTAPSTNASSNPYNVTISVKSNN